MPHYSNFGRRGGSEVPKRRQYVRFAYSGEAAGKFDVSLLKRQAELKGEEYDPSKKIFYYYLNQKGLFEEVGSVEKGLEVILSYDGRLDRQVPTQIRLKGKTYTIDEFVECQTRECSRRYLEATKTGRLDDEVFIGFVSYPTVYDYVSYSKYKEMIEKESTPEGRKEKLRQKQKNIRKRNFGYGRKLEE